VCGFVGALLGPGGRGIDRRALDRSADTLVHRGPDDSGSFVSQDGRYGVGFRRLSIIDPAGGHQPLVSPDGDICVTVNGEIYNHAELRSELEGLGHRYRTGSDSEAILHGYEEWGDAVVDRLRGMFALAVFDGRQNGAGRLLLARDRMGVKPLYHRSTPDGLIFASEIKAILAWPGVSAEVDNLALDHYLTLSATPAPSTMFEGISKLQPGHVLTVESNGRVETRSYWDPTSGGVDLGDASEQEIAALVRNGLRESIDLRMMSDVPFGVFLSGGVDSSLNVAMMSEMMDRPVDTFSVSLQGDPESDENEHARRVAKHFGTKHREVEVTPQQFIEFLPQMVRHQDEPLADPVCVPLYFVSKLAKDSGTTVVQVGEGADELFAGYNGYAVMSDFHRRTFGPFARLPAPVKRLAALAAPALMPGRRAEYVRRAAANEELFWGGAVVFSGKDKRRLVRNGAGDRSYRDVIAGYYAEYDRARPGMSFLDRAIHVELRHRLPELLLMRVDKMSMAASVEARVPFLDHKLVELALSIPSSLKYKNGRTKHILKEAAAPLLPSGVIDRPKKGFCGGTTNMIGPPVAEYAANVIRSSEFLASRLHMPYVNDLVGQHLSGRVNRGAEVWSLMNLALWHRVWVEGEHS